MTFLAIIVIAVQARLFEDEALFYLRGVPLRSLFTAFCKSRDHCDIKL